jgi:DNA mismatch endonuclease (patch repair protein)
MDRHSPEQRRKNMQAVRSKGSKMELTLACAMRKNGLFYRKNVKSIFGTPDFAFISLKIAIFCDSEFFHGRNWEIKKHEIKSNREFWYAKIESNIRRDTAVNKQLLSEGWTVLRFWESDVIQNTEKCIEMIFKARQQKTQFSKLSKE